MIVVYVQFMVLNTATNYTTLRILANVLIILYIHIITLTKSDSVVISSLIKI